jgi:hypothetical protein
MIMTNNTKGRAAADIDVILDEANLDAVNGGSVGDGVARAVLSWQLNNAVVGYLSGQIIKEGGPCPYGPK